MFFRQNAKSDRRDNQQEERDEKAKPPAIRENQQPQTTRSEKNDGQKQNAQNQTAQRQQRTPKGTEKTRRRSEQPSQRPSHNQLKLAPRREQTAAGQRGQQKQQRRENENPKNRRKQDQKRQTAKRERTRQKPRINNYNYNTKTEAQTSPNPDRAKNTANNSHRRKEANTLSSLFSPLSQKNKPSAARQPNVTSERSTQECDKSTAIERTMGAMFTSDPNQRAWATTKKK